MAWSRIYIDRQITNSVVCDASKDGIYKQIKPPLVSEHAFPLTGFVCRSAHVTSFWYLLVLYLNIVCKNSRFLLKMTFFLFGGHLMLP